VQVNPKLLDQVRSRSSELENETIDEFVAGRLSRRDFLRRGSVIGISVTSMGAVLAACGNANKTVGNASSASSGSASASGTAKKGATLRVANQVPAAAINPITIADNGGLEMLCQVGDFLIFDNTGRPGPHLLPSLATSWKPNGDGSVWTFKLRQGVKFHNGQPMTADDVVYTMQQQCDPKNAANALSVFGGILSPSGVKKVDSSTVAFHLNQPIGSFPYLVSSDNYNSIIVPKGTDFAKWQKTMIGTGAFKLKSYTQNVGANFVANPDYWGPKPKLAGSAWTFYQSQSPMILALQGGQVDMISALSQAGATALFNSSSYKIVTIHASLHRELSMRTDQPPFNDARVRQAMALTVDRPGMVKALLAGFGTPGNDSPFAPIFASTDKSVAQRTLDLTKAKQLMSAAGHSSGINATMFTEQFQEIPQLAQAFAAGAKKAGININLKVETQAAYYGKATFGNSDWLDGQMSLVDYGCRGVPNTVLQATLTSKGVWNAAHFKNPQLDSLYKQFVAAVDLTTQTKLAGQMQTLLLNETPLIIPYFEDELNATTPNVNGVLGSQIQQTFLGSAFMT
jgi:peptide/nickel transport system substrate-binding protein